MLTAARSGSGRPRRVVGLALATPARTPSCGTPASRSARPRRVPSGASSWASRRHEHPDQRTEQPAGDDPDRRVRRRGDERPRRVAPTAAATSSRRPVIRPDAQAGHRGREDDVEPERDGSAIWPPRTTPASVATFHGMNVDDDRGDPVAADVGPADPPEVGDRQRERLVGQDVGHDRPLPARPVAQPRRERGRVEEVAGVEERRQEDDAGQAEPAGDVADGRELGGAGEDERRSSPSPRSARSRRPRAASP